jgi:hypothetical protein
MAVKFPQADMPRGVRGASFLGDAEALFDVDYFSPVGLPVITAQPTNQSATVGGTATFTATVTGTGLTYQWQRLAPS